MGIVTDGVLLFSMFSLGCILAPYTKVEEQFNLEVTHDMLHHGQNLSLYDYNEHPGVVPRTFLGAFMTALPVLWVPWTRLHLLAIRLVLAFYTTCSLLFIRQAVAKRYSTHEARMFTLLMMTQFHVVFWMTRTIPNTYAFLFTNTALAFWLGDRSRRPNSPKLTWMIRVLTFVTAVFRSELVLLSGSLSLVLLIQRRITPIHLMKTILISLIASLALSISVDSWMWCQSAFSHWCFYHSSWIYPEFSVFYFNTIMNQSSAWGTSPWWWYFVIAIPKMAFLALVFILAGTLGEQRLRHKDVWAVIILFVGLYSVLPHKELRFIIYIAPLFSFLAARYISAWNRWIVYAMIIPVVAANILMIMISSLNYPGAVALEHLHYAYTDPQRVHMDFTMAMTGWTRYLEPPHNVTWWIDDVLMEDVDRYQPDLVVTAHPEWLCSRHWTIENEIYAYHGIQPRLTLPLDLMRDMLHVYAWQKDVVVHRTVHKATCEDLSMDSVKSIWGVVRIKPYGYILRRPD